MTAASPAAAPDLMHGIHEAFSIANAAPTGATPAEAAGAQAAWH